jgi:hypothetical protein
MGGPSPRRKFPWPAKGATGSQQNSAQQQQAWLGSGTLHLHCMHHLITSHDAYRLSPFIIPLFFSLISNGP